MVSDRDGSSSACVVSSRRILSSAAQSFWVASRAASVAEAQTSAASSAICRRSSSCRVSAVRARLRLLMGMFLGERCRSQRPDLGGPSRYNLGRLCAALRCLPRFYLPEMGNGCAGRLFDDNPIETGSRMDSLRYLESELADLGRAWY